MDQPKPRQTATRLGNRTKKAIKRQCKSIHDRFTNDPVYRASQLKIEWTEAICLKMDHLAQQDHHYVANCVLVEVDGLIEATFLGLVRALFDVLVPAS